MLRAAPIVLGYVGGFAYGVLAQKAGLSGFNVVMMSVLVYAARPSSLPSACWEPSPGLFHHPDHPGRQPAPPDHGLRPWLVSETLAGLADRLFFGRADGRNLCRAFHGLFEGSPGPSEVFAVNVTAHLSWVFGSFLGVIGGR